MQTVREEKGNNHTDADDAATDGSGADDAATNAATNDAATNDAATDGSSTGDATRIRDGTSTVSAGPMSDRDRAMRECLAAVQQ